MSLKETALELIGNTPIVKLNYIRPSSSSGATIYLKIESQNPTGSMKDRMALAMITAAEADGSLQPGDSVVEYTGGSTGVSLALICSVKKYPLYLVSSDAFSKEKLDHMRLLGAHVTLVPSDNGRQTGELTRNMIVEAHKIAKERRAFITDQMENANQLNAYTALADEIWDQMDRKVDAFVQSIGTAASFRGTSERLRDLNPDIQCVAVEPSESAVLSGESTGSHGIDGIGAGYVTPLWKEGVANEIVKVSTADAKAMVLRLAIEEGLFCGTSTGANVVAALKVAEALGPDAATVVTIMCDTGMKYLSGY